VFDFVFADIDTQVDFIEPSGKLYANGAEAIKENLGKLISFARAQKIPLISSVDCHPENDPEFEQFPPHCIRDSEGQKKIPETTTGEEVFVAQAAEDFPDPKTHHIVIEKQGFPVFTNPVAEKVFAATGMRTVYVFGVVTEVCVLAAALGLVERDYNVKLITDAIWPITKEGGEKALAEMKEKGVEFVTTEGVLKAAAAPI
jgi:nicotinamidase/pyrazinamidase